jgi:hypothetical protein
MRSIRSTGLIGVLVCAIAAVGHAQNWTIVPGASVGPITASTSEAELITIYGKANIKRIQLDVGEGEMLPATAVFPADPTRNAAILWRDPETRLRPESVTITGHKSLWKTDTGITLGTPLTTIEQLNGRPFIMTGFAWDYEGTVLHADGGKLSVLGSLSGEEITGQTLMLRLAPAARFRSSAEYKSVTGDSGFFSDNAAMKMINPAVYQMIIELAP